MFRTETPRKTTLFPFRPSPAKSPSSSPKALSLLSASFDDALLRSLRSLISASSLPSSALSWLALAVSHVSSLHSLLSDLSPSTPSKSLAFYLDDSVKLLDVCNSISSEIERLRQSRLLLHHALHLLRPTSPSPDDLRRARDSLADWSKPSPPTKRLTLDASAALLAYLVRRLAAFPPRGKVSSPEKLLQRAIYSVGAITVFVAGVAVSALSGSPSPPKVPLSGDFPWLDAFHDLQARVLERLGGRFSAEKAALEASVRSLSDAVSDVAGNGSAEHLADAVSELERVTEDLSNGLEALLNGVNGLFRAVLCTRNTVLRSLRETA